MYTSYQRIIHELSPGVEPRFAEAYLRLEYGTLDHLSRETFKREIKIAEACIAACTPAQNEALAASFGL